MNKDLKGLLFGFLCFVCGGLLAVVIINPLDTTSVIFLVITMFSAAVAGLIFVLE